MQKFTQTHENSQSLREVVADPVPSPGISDLHMVPAGCLCSRGIAVWLWLFSSVFTADKTCLASPCKWAQSHNRVCCSGLGGPGRTVALWAVTLVLSSPFFPCSLETKWEMEMREAFLGCWSGYMFVYVDRDIARERFSCTYKKRVIGGVAPSKMLLNLW